MKKFLLLSLFAFMAFQANAQLKIGLKGGFNVTRVSLSSNLADNFSADNREGFFAGLSVKFPVYVVLPITLETSVLYNKMWQGIENTSIARESIAIPVNAQLKFTKHTFIYAGPQLDFDITDKDYTILNASSMVNDYSLKDANVSVNVGAGIHAGNMQLTVNFNKALGDYGEVNFTTAKDGVTEVVRGTSKADSWWVGLTYYF